MKSTSIVAGTVSSVSTSIIVGMVSSVLLIGAAIALHFLTPPDFDARFRTAIGSVQAMQQLGAEWSVETARVRADPSANFDGLAAFVPRMKQLKENLSESLAHIPDLPERLTADSRAYLAAMDSLRERVERFKTAYAVIRNSERYFPLASADLILRTEQAGNKRLAREIADVSVEMDAYLSSPSRIARESLSARLLELTEGRTRETEQVASSIANFAAHANVLLDRRARSQELFKGITSSTLSERTRPLTGTLEAEFEERRRATTLHRQALVGLGAVVLLVWVAVGFARRSATTWRSASERYAPSQQGAAEPEVVSGPEPVRVAAGPRAGGATQRDEEGTDVMGALLTTGAFAGLMGQSMGAYARRMGEDLKALDRDAEGAQTEREAEEAQRWRRLQADARRLGFFAHRLVVLGRHLAPKDRESVDVNQCLDQALSEAGVELTCVVERYCKAVPDVLASRAEVRLILAMCIGHVLRSFQDMTSFEAELEVWTAAATESVTISFIHNGGWLPPDQRANQFIPFYGSQDQTAALELPAARHLARKYGGTVNLDSLPDERSVLSVELAVHAERQ